MSRKKKVSENARQVINHLGEDVDLLMLDNLFAGKGRSEGFAIHDKKEATEYDEKLFSYTDLQSKIIGACADEYIQLRNTGQDDATNEEDVKLSELGRVITTSASVADSYAELLSELRFARNEAHVESIMSRYHIGKDELPAARLFAHLYVQKNKKAVNE